MYITFDNPIYLWLLFSVPLFIISHFYFLRRSKSKAIRFANFDTLRRISEEKIPTKNITHLLLRILILFALVIAVSGTKMWYMGYGNDSDFVIALDNSASMTSEDVRPSRFKAAKQYIDEFLGALDSSTRIGLVTFAGITTIEQELTDSRLEFKLSLDRTEISKTGGTDIPGAIITSTNMLVGNGDSGRTIILISDGVNTVDSFISDSIAEATAYAKDHNVIVHTIGVGTNSGPIGYLPEYYNISATFEGNTLGYIANETEGFYVRAPSTNELIQAYKAVADKRDEKYLSFNIGFVAMLLSIGMLFIEWGLSNTIYRRIM